MPTKALMWSLAVVDVQMFPDGGSGLGHVGVGPEVDLLVFDALPDPPDEDVVPPSPFAIHTGRP